MNLYLVRHGEAGSAFTDAERPLTEAGRDEVARVASHAATRGVEVHEIRHSGRKRAEQTALILAEALRPTAGVIEVPGLHPGDDPENVAFALPAEPGPLMLVGHLPFMGCLAGLLLTGDVERAPISFSTGTLACLHHAGEHWQSSWVVSPGQP